MSSKSAPAVCLLLLITTTLFAQGKAQPPSPGGGPESATVVVNCPDDSINEALKKPADTLTIEIRGVCSENVVVRRDNVILRGADPANDGIRGTGVEGTKLIPVLYIDESRNVDIENLSITDSTRWGMYLASSIDVVVRNSRFVNNQRDGILAIFSEGQVIDSRFEGRPDGTTRSGVALFSSDVFTLTNCMISGAIDGVLAVGSRVAVRGSNVAATRWAFLPTERGQLDVTGTTFAGGIRVVWNSLLAMNTSTQTSVGTGGNSVITDSTAQLNFGTVLAGPLRAFAFSKVLLLADAGGPSARINGDLACISAAQAFCVDPSAVSGTITNCGQCTTGSQQAAQASALAGSTAAQDFQPMTDHPAMETLRPAP